jgi:hypothetical protein
MLMATPAPDEMASTAVGTVTKKIITKITDGIKKLNPSNWFLTTTCKTFYESFS